MPVGKKAEIFYAPLINGRKWKTMGSNRRYAIPMGNTIDFAAEADAFRVLLDSAPNEQTLQAYIKQGERWFIPYTIQNESQFKLNSMQYLYEELPLQEKYVADYALLGENSDGYHLILVEFESPAEEQFLLKNSDGEIEVVRNGFIQIADWQRWLDYNRLSFLDSIGLIDKGIKIPSDRTHYCLVVSRRSFEERVQAKKSQLQADKNLTIMSYDRLADGIELLSSVYYCPECYRTVEADATACRKGCVASN